ncbi:MAG: endonuclease III [Sediminibacterium sp.]
MKKQARYQGVIDFFLANVPIAETELTYDNPFQLLVAVILSAQCTDKRVNLTTPGIFKKFPDPASMSKASFDDLFPLIRSISYPNNKTKHLIGMSQLLMDTFNGAVPMTIEDLIKLPGVGRKTANVITSVIDQQPNMAVDTHVFRVSRRVGLVPLTAKTPLAVEKDLIKNIPAVLVHKAHHWLILHGRYTCLARSPKCDSCGITAFCKYFEKETKKKVSK